MTPGGVRPTAVFLLGLCVLGSLGTAVAFRPSNCGPSSCARGHASRRLRSTHLGLVHRRPAVEPQAVKSKPTAEEWENEVTELWSDATDNASQRAIADALALTLATASALLLFVGVWADNGSAALAAGVDGSTLPNPQAIFDPKTFQPVCSASDAVYRYLQALFLSLIGRENYEDYAPLIAGGILRVRLELCVLESFVSEAILPFIKEKGLSWVLPLHETVETFLAGTVFAIASNFILLGSTKIISVLGAYADFFFGLPLRVLGGFVWDRAFESAVDDQQLKEIKKENLKGFPLFGSQIKALASPGQDSDLTAPILAVLGVSGVTRLVGYASKSARTVTELADTFVGRYLIYTTVGYVLLKFAHFKFFPDFP